MDSRWVQATRKLYAPLEKLDGLLGVWERIPRIVKTTARGIVLYALIQWGAAASARALEVGRDNALLIVLGAVIATAIAWVLVEHYLPFRAPDAKSRGKPDDCAAMTPPRQEQVIPIRIRTIYQTKSFATSMWADLTLEVPDRVGGMWSYECIVTDPDGIGTSSKPQGGILSMGQITVRYPNEFPNASPLVSGTYKVE